MLKLLAWLPWFRPKAKDPVQTSLERARAGAVKLTQSLEKSRRPPAKRIVQVPLTGRTRRDSDFFTMSPEDFHDACGDRD